MLRDIDFAVAPGTLTALVGPSGAGKTTITQLVPRLYDVRGGAVTINGMDVRDAMLASLHARIGIVTQDAHLFQRVDPQPICLFAKPDASEAELEAALRAAQIWPLVVSLPDEAGNARGRARLSLLRRRKSSACRSRGCC